MLAAFSLLEKTNTNLNINFIIYNKKGMINKMSLT